MLNSKGLALILSTCISLILTGSLLLIPEVPEVVLWVVPFISFGTGYILINVVLEFLFFRELRDIFDLFKEIKENNYSFFQSRKKYVHSSLNQIHDSLHEYAEVKQNEIDELKKMAKFRRQFLADVSHELKTPIFAAQGFVYTLLDGAVEDKTIRMKFLRKAAKNLDGLDALVQDLLTVSYVEAGDITMHVAPTNIVELILDIFDSLEEKAQKNGISLNINLTKDKPVYVNVDSQRIYQVLINLISNAIKYSNENAEVRVELLTDGPKINISIKDQGIGIPAEHLPRIFERFYRVDKSRSKAQGGTGLGLSIVKHILEAHDSEINVASIQGEGSTFSFDLDLVQDHLN